MTDLEFLSALIKNWVDLLGAVAWPVAAVTIALLFKREIHRLLQGLRSLKLGPLDAQFREELEQAHTVAKDIPIEGQPDQSAAEDILSSMELMADEIATNAHPTGTIMEAWKSVEWLLFQVAERFEVTQKLRTHTKPYARASRLADRDLLALGVISNSEAELINHLRRLRNQVAHSNDISLTHNNVLEYVALADLAKRSLSKLLSDQNKAD